MMVNYCQMLMTIYTVEPLLVKYWTVLHSNESAYVKQIWNTCYYNFSLVISRLIVVITDHIDRFLTPKCLNTDASTVPRLMQHSA